MPMLSDSNKNEVDKEEKLITTPTARGMPMRPRVEPMDLIFASCSKSRGQREISSTWLIGFTPPMPSPIKAMLR